MKLLRYLLILASGLTLAFASMEGCGGSGQTGGLTGTGGAGGSSATSSASGNALTAVCKGQFVDEGTTCSDCLAMNCVMEATACCSVPDKSCEPLAKCARGKMCSGEQCYGTAAAPGPCKGLIDDPDFGGHDGPGWKAASPLTVCTAMKCAGLCPK